MSVGGWLVVIGAYMLAVAISLVAMRLLGRRRTTTLGCTAQGLARRNAKLVHAAGDAEIGESSSGPTRLGPALCSTTSRRRSTMLTPILLTCSTAVGEPPGADLEVRSIDKEQGRAPAASRRPEGLPLALNAPDGTRCVDADGSLLSGTFLPVPLDLYIARRDLALEYRLNHTGRGSVIA